MAIDQYAVVASGLDALKDLQSLDSDIVTAARMAINKTLDHERAVAARLIRRQINFPAAYVSPSQGRLAVYRRPTDASLEGSIRAQGRATSLARFAVSRDPSLARRLGGVNVAVKPGLARFVRKAFLVKLRAGNAITDTQANLGLAVRLKPGEVLRNRHLRAKPLFPNVYLLYSASVYQVFSSVAEDEAPNAVQYLEAEFLRVLEI